MPNFVILNVAFHSHLRFFPYWCGFYARYSSFDMVKKGMDFAQGAVKSRLRQLSDAELEEILNSDKSEKIKQFVREELNRRKSFW